MQLGKNFQFCYTTELRETPLSILRTCHYENLSSTFDLLKQIYNQLNFFARSSDFIWRENQCCLCEMLAFFSGYGVLNVLDSFCFNARLVILSSALEISSQSGVIPARTSQKITATAYPSRRIAYQFKLSYELLSMFGMYALVSPGPFSFCVLCSEKSSFRIVPCNITLSWLFQSCLKPLFQSEAKCKATDMKTFFILMRIKLMFTRKVSHFAWF